jgi:hypothetical protein
LLDAVMDFCSGPPMQFLSGVDIDRRGHEPPLLVLTVRKKVESNFSDINGPAAACPVAQFSSELHKNMSV